MTAAQTPVLSFKLQSTIFNPTSAVRATYFLLAVILGWLVLFRAVNLDEGWYLGAARWVYEGRLLYRDFAYTQSPLLPYIYGIAHLWPGGPLYGGRILTVLFALATLALTGSIARRLGGRTAQLFSLLLFASSLYPLAFYAYSATYALAAFWLMLAVYSAMTMRNQTLRSAATTACLCMAVGVRLSAIAAAPALLLYLLYISRDRLRSLLVIAATSLATLAVIFGPFLLAAGPSTVLYDIFGFHTDRMLPAWQIEASRRAVIETVAVFLLPLVAAAVGVLLHVLGPVGAGSPRPVPLNESGRGNPAPTMPNTRNTPLILALAGMALMMAIVHLLPRTAAAYYNSLAMPLVAVLGGLGLAQLWERRKRRGISSCVAGASIAALLMVNAAGQWAILQRQKIIGSPPFNQIAQVKAAAAALRADYAQTPEIDGRPLLTFNTHLALEAGLDVPPGFEMSIFSYRPEWTTEQAQRNHAINNQMLLDLWQNAAGPVALTEFDLERLFGDRDALLDALNSSYRWVRSVPRFGPFFDDLRIYQPPHYTPPQPQVTQQARLEGGIRLLGYDLEREKHAGDERLRLGLYWQAEGPTGSPITVFTHLLDASGKLAAGQDNQPCHNTCPTTGWRPSEVIRDEYVLPLAGSGSYVLEIGMYEAATGRRLAIVSDTGEAVDDRIVLQDVLP